MKTVYIFNSGSESDLVARSVFETLQEFFNAAGFASTKKLELSDIFVLILPSSYSEATGALNEAVFATQQAQLIGKRVFLFNYSSFFDKLLQNVLLPMVHGVSALDPLVLAELQRKFNLPVFLLEPTLLFVKSFSIKSKKILSNGQLIGVQSRYLQSALDKGLLSSFEYISYSPNLLSDDELSELLCSCKAVIASDLRTLVACVLLRIPFFQVSEVGAVEFGLSARIALPVLDSVFSMPTALLTLIQYEQSFERLFNWSSGLKLNLPLLERFFLLSPGEMSLSVTPPGSRLKTYVKFKNSKAICRLPSFSEITKANPELVSFVFQAKLLMGEFISVLHDAYVHRLSNRSDSLSLNLQLNIARGYDAFTWLSDSYPSIFKRFSSLELKSHFITESDFIILLGELKNQVVQKYGDFALGSLRLVFAYIFKSAQGYKYAKLICDQFVSEQCGLEDVLIDRLYTHASELDDISVVIDQVLLTEYSKNQEVLRYLVQTLARIDGVSDKLFEFIDKVLSGPDLSSSLIFDCFCILASTSKNQQLLSYGSLLTDEVISRIDKFSPLMSYDLRKLGVIKAPPQELSILGEVLSNNLDKLRGLLSDKSLSVAVVGNSPCEQGKAKGHEIDSHDIVIRFNHFDTNPPYDIDYGKKTTVVFSIYLEENSRQRTGYLEKGGFLVYAAATQGYTAGSWTHCLSVHEQGLIHPTALDHAFRLEFTKKFGCLASTGLYVAAWLKSLRGELDRSSFYGFSFVDQVGLGKRAHYFDHEAASHMHNWDQEAIYFESLFQ